MGHGVPIAQAKQKHMEDVAQWGNGFYEIKPPSLLQFEFGELRPCSESFCKNLIELQPLFKRHYEEVSVHYKHAIPLDPDWDAYQLKELKGELLFIALRKQGKLVGYFNGFIGRALHYNVLSLALDLFYVIPEMRGRKNGNAGKILLDSVKSEAKRRGVRLITMGAKSHRLKHLEKLLIENGFEQFEVHYSLWI